MSKGAEPNIPPPPGGSPTHPQARAHYRPWLRAILWVASDYWTGDEIADYMEEIFAEKESEGGFSWEEGSAT